MGIFDLFKRKEKVSETAVSNENVDKDIKKSAEPTKSKKKSEKELATERGEPYIEILRMDVNPNNVCRNVVLETYEQYEAMNNDSRYMQSRDLGDGRREIG